MKKSTIKYFHIRIRLIVTLVGVAVLFLGFLELSLSPNLLALLIFSFGYSIMVIGTWCLKPRYPLSARISTIPGILFGTTIITLVIHLFLSFTTTPSFSLLIILLFVLVPCIMMLAFITIYSSPVIFQNLLKLSLLRNIRSLILSFLIVYISCIFFFALCYATVYKLIPDSFEANQSLSFFDITYYSVVTITTLGYGDIRALGWIPRLLSMIEVIIGLGLVVIYVGITAAILLRESFKKK